MSLLDTISGALTPELLAQLAGSVGAEKPKAKSAVDLALPMLVSALAKNASKPQGAQALDTALAKDHDGSALDGVGAFIGDALKGKGAGGAILAHVLGPKQPAVEAEIGKKSGVDAAQVAQILATLVPLVMGALGKKKREENLDAAGVARTLEQDKAQAQAQAAEEPSFFTKLLDSDGDGDVMDDLAGHASTIAGLFASKPQA